MNSDRRQTRHLVHTGFPPVSVSCFGSCLFGTDSSRFVPPSLRVQGEDFTVNSGFPGGGGGGGEGGAAGGVTRTDTSGYVDVLQQRRLGKGKVELNH